MLGGKHTAGAAHAGLHFVVNQQNAVFVSKPPEFFMKLCWRNEIAAFSLNGLDDDGGDFFGRQDRLK